jgi:hypothetical protein
MIFQSSLRLPSCPVWVGSDDHMERADTGRDKSVQSDVDLHLCVHRSRHESRNYDLGIVGFVDIIVT